MGKSISMAFSGDGALLAELKRIQKMDEVKRIVSENGARLQTKAQARTGVTYAHPTGATKRSIGISMSSGGLSATVYMGMDYNPLNVAA